MERDSQEIRLCALVLSVVAFFLFIAAEAAHEAAHVAPRGVLLLVASGALAFAWIGPLTLLAGTLRARSFQWWQPFRGGADFVWMQAYGWCFHTFVLTGAVVVLANPQVPKWFEGQYLLLGAMGFMAQILLNLSIGCFREPPSRSADRDEREPAFRFPLNTKAVGSLLVSASATLMFVCYDLFSTRGRSTVMIALGCVEFTVSALVIHVLYGCAEIPGFRLWQPFEGERTFLLLQYLGWQLFALTIGGALGIFCRAGDDSVYGTSRGTAAAVGAMGMTSQILLLTSLQYFVKSSSPNNKETTTRASGLKQQLKPTSRYPAEVYVASLLCAGAVGVGCVSYVARVYTDVIPEQLVRFCVGHETVGWIISLSSLAIAAPIANMGGVRATETYRWWQPFQGGTKFVFLQTIGWLWYGVFLALAIVLCMNSTYVGQVAGCVVLFVGTGSAGAIALSLHYFEPLKRHRVAGVEDPQCTRGSCVDDVRGDVAMVALLALSSLLLRVVLDYFQAQLQVSVRALCLVLAMTLFVLAATVSHFAGRKLHRHFRLWQPFEGGDRFVVRQAVGWAVFGVQLLFDSLLLTLTSSGVPFGALSLLGVFALVPLFLIMSSIQYFQSPVTTATQSRLLQATRGDTGSRSWTALLHDASLKWHVWSSILVVVSSACLFVCAEVLGTSFLRAEEVLYAFGCLLSLFGVLFTHCVLGPRAYASYRVFQPFRGGVEFVTFHGAAWTLVAIAWALAMTVMYWSALFLTIPGIHVITGMLCTVPQTLLLMSIPLFKPAEAARCSTRFIATHGTDKRRHELNSRADDLANQYFVGRLLGVSACIVFVLLDLAMVRWGPAIPAFPMSVSAVFALFSSIPLSYTFASSHYGRKAKSISGSIVFVVLGCALWSFTLLLGALFSYNFWRVQESGRSVAGPTESTKYMGSFTGSVGFAAQLLLFQASECSRGDAKHALASPRAEKLLLSIVASVKSYVPLGSLWVYSSVPLVVMLTYAHTKSASVKHVVTPQTLVLMLCSCAVIWSAWWIQQQIFSTGSVCLLSSSSVAKVRPIPLAPPTKAPADHPIPALDIGFDCYLQVAAFLTVAELIQFSAVSKGLTKVHSESFWRRVFIERFDPTARSIRPRELPSLQGRSQPSAASVGTRPFAATALNRVEDAVLSWICRLKKPPRSFTPGKQNSVHMYVLEPGGVQAER